MQEVLTWEAANAELLKWLEYKRISPEMRGRKVEYLFQLAQAIQYGQIVLNEDMSLTQKLQCPIGSGDAQIGTFQFKTRLLQGDIRPRLTGLDAEDWHGIITAYACALVNQPSSVIDLVDTEDFKTTRAVTAFFI